MNAKNQHHNNTDDQNITSGEGFDCDNGGHEATNGQHANVSDGDATGDNPAGATDTAAEAEVWKDKYLRLSAEFDNYRKRTLKEKLDLVATGGEDVIRALLPVIDDIDRALEAMHKTDDIESVRTGIELISTKLRDTLASRGLSEIEAMGNELDTDLHEAIAKIPADKKQRGKIVDVVQKGYKLKDKVVRHAKCVVGE